MVIDVLGTVLAVDAPKPLLSELRHLIKDLAVNQAPTRKLLIEPDGSGSLRLVDDDVVVHAGIAPVIGSATLVWWLNVVAAETASQLLIHAACVGGPGAVLLPGESGTGKSTLAAACVADGLTYLSDEYAALDRKTGMIVPYPRPLELHGQRLVAASTLGRVSTETPLAPAGIVFPRFQRGAPSTVTALGPGWTFLALVAHAANLGRLGAEAVPWLAALAVGCPAWQATYGDAHDAVGLVHELAKQGPVELRPAPLIGPVTDATVTVALGDEVGVFDVTTGRVHLLNPSAAAVWSGVAEGGTELSGLRDLVLARVSDPALDQPAVEATIAQLVALGLLAGPGRRDDG